MHIRHRLRLDSLRGVHDEQRSFARGKRPRDFVGEVHMPGRVHEVELVLLSIPRLVHHPHGMRLDGDAALALEVHRVEKLLLRFALLDRAGEFEQPIGKRGLTVIDMSDDAEIARVARHGVFGKKGGGICVAFAPASTRATMRRNAQSDASRAIAKLPIEPSRPHEHLAVGRRAHLQAVRMPIRTGHRPQSYEWDATRRGARNAAACRLQCMQTRKSAAKSTSLASVLR